MPKYVPSTPNKKKKTTKKTVKVGYIIGHFNRSTQRCVYLKWTNDYKKATVFTSVKDVEAKRRSIGKQRRNSIIFISKCYYTPVSYSNVSYRPVTLTRINPLQAISGLLYNL